MSNRRALHRAGNPVEFNLALVGALSVGKSALTCKYITKRFIMEYDPDLEGTYTKHEDWDGQDMVVHVMDTCDKEDSDPSRYLRWADGFLIVYSITQRPSYDTARDYLDSISLYLKSQGRECPLALVGNKMDLERYRQVNKTEGAALATEYDAVFYETTAAEEYELVERVFHRVLQDTYQDKFGHLPPSMFIADDSPTTFTSTLTRRPKSPKSQTGSMIEKKDEKMPQKKTLNKFFKIFN